jgi:hypothetical protein
MPLNYFFLAKKLKIIYLKKIRIDRAASLIIVIVDITEA